MGIGALVSVEEYLRTSYRPDCDFVEGRVLERNVGEKGSFLSRLFSYALTLTLSQREREFKQRKPQG